MMSHLNLKTISYVPLPHPISLLNHSTLGYQTPSSSTSAPCASCGMVIASPDEKIGSLCKATTTTNNSKMMLGKLKEIKQWNEDDVAVVRKSYFIESLVSKKVNVLNSTLKHTKCSMTNQARN